MPIEMANILGAVHIVTDKHTQLAIGKMGSATILRVGVQNSAASGAKILVCIPTCDILEVH